MPSTINSDDGVVSGSAGLKTSGANDGILALQNNGTTNVTVTAAGNVGVGTTSPGAKLDAVGAVRASSSTSSTNIGISGGNGYIQSFDSSTTNIPLTFLVGTTERARFDTSGNLLVGTTSQPISGVASRLAVSYATADYALGVANTHASTPYGEIIKYTAASPNGTGNEFINCADSTTARMTVRSNGGIANYSANNVNLSDRREKTNFAPSKSYLDKICAIPVQTFNYIDQPEDDPGLTLGVVAQDVHAVAPELVMESNWGTEEEPKMRLSIYQTDLQYALMKCIQEQQALITDLQTRLAALEAKG